MIKEKLITNIFEVIIALKEMYRIDYFDHIKKFINIYNNYEFIINAEIIINKESNNKGDIPIDFIEGAEPFNIKITQPEQLSIKKCEYTIAKINRNGFIILPGTFYETGEGALFKEQFEKFLKYKKERARKELLDIIENIIEREKYKVNEEKMTELISIINSDTKKYNINLNINQHNTNNLMELDPSTFYFLNELVAGFLLGGSWWHLVIDSDYESIFPVLKLEDDKEYIKLYGDAVLLYKGNYLRERVIELSPPWRNMINYKLRGFHNGYYCPINKLEYIAGLSYFIPVKENFTKIVDYIETLPFPETQTSFAKEIIKKFEEKGFIKKEENEEQKQMKEAILLLLELYPEIKDLKKKQEAHAIQTAKIFSISLNFQEMPDFINLLDSDYKKRYKNIHRNIMMLRLPIVKEEPADYIDVINQLGTFVSNVLKNVLHVDVTISSLAKNDKAKEILGKLQEEKSNNLINYSEKFGKIFNDVKHNPDKVKRIGFDITTEFIDDSHKVLEIVLRNRKLFE